MKNNFDYDHDRRQISMPFEVYNTDLAKADSRGRRDALQRFLSILEKAKTDKRDAICLVVEQFEDDQRSIDRMLNALDLMKDAEEIWGKRSDAEAKGVGYE